MQIENQGSGQNNVLPVAFITSGTVPRTGITDVRHARRLSYQIQGTGPSGAFGSSPTLLTAVVVATTTNGTLASSFENGDTVDGVTLSTGDRILLKNQTTASQNGIYIVAASGAPARSSDADTGAEIFNTYVLSTGGTVNAGLYYWLSNSTVPTLGTTALVYAQVPLAGVAGTWQVQASNNYSHYADAASGGIWDDGTWVNVTGLVKSTVAGVTAVGSIPASTGTGEDVMVTMDDVDFRHVRIQFTPTGGQGAGQNVRAFIVSKST